MTACRGLLLVGVVAGTGLAAACGPKPTAGVATVDAGSSGPGAGSGATAASTAASTGATAACGCADYAAPKSVGKLGGEIDEASGLAASRVHPQVFWVHNDSGDSARVFALREDGTELAQVALAGVKARDFEDVAVGPCPAGSCVYVADIGDNNKVRKSLVVHRFPEPKPLSGHLTVTPESFRFRYPDGPHNAEALLVHPKTGEVAVVTKATFGAVSVYRFPSPLSADTEVVLEAVGDVVGLDPLSQLVTAGSVSPCGDRLLLRTYGHLYEYKVTGSVAAALLSAPRDVPVADEAQGEAVTYRADGKGYLTTSEGLGAPLFATTCAP